MTLFPPAFLDSLRDDGDPGVWPAVLADRVELRRRLESALALQIPAVRDVLVTPLLRDPEGAGWARSALWGLSLAGLAGFRAIGVVDDYAFRLQNAKGHRFVLAPMAFRTRAGHAGDPAHVAALLQVLERSLSEHRFVVHVKKPLPADFDPGPIGQAVQLWLLALRQGTWHERYVVYEDGDLCIEIGLTQADRGNAARGLVCVVGPHRSLERMAEVDARVVDLAATLGSRIGDDPLIPLLSAQPRWRLSRGYVTQLLYGTPRETCAEREADRKSIQVTYEPNGLSLFSDPGSRRIAGIWWAEPEGEALGLRAWAHENPWCVPAGRLVRFPGLRYAALGSAEHPKAPANMTWTAAGATTWNPAS